MSPTPPPIDDDGWGRITVDGRTYKDVKLWPGGVRAWDWTDTGTNHADGIQPDDVRELLGHGVDHVILSRGRERRLQIDPATEDVLTNAGVAYEILETGEAISRYATLRDGGTAVGALLHTTC